MRGYVFDLTCPACGGELVHVADGSKRPWQRAAMARCSGCRKDILVNVEVSFAVDNNTSQQYRIAEGRKVALEAEHEAAMAESRSLLASA